VEPFVYERATDVASTVAVLDERTAVIAGGTELLNLLKERIVTPDRVLDINRLALGQITFDGTTLHLGALARMSDVAAHPAVRASFPALAESLEKSASPQLRNMASMGGNLLQRTRCAYFRADTALPCNKRTPGSGCAARDGNTRQQAIFGWSEACVATHPSDVAVALAAFDADVSVRGRRGERSIALADFYRLPDDRPDRDTTLEPGELIVGIDVRASDLTRRSHYLKVRERASYEFALVSVAAGVELDGETVRDVRIALGGVAHKPWRLSDAEASLRGRPFTRAAVREAVSGAFGAARPLRDNAFKIALAQRAIVRVLGTLGARA